jgi:hypothetical protein
MTMVGSSTLLPTRFGAAIVAAILLAMVAAATDPENGIAFMPTAKPLAENIFSNPSHSHLKARLDNGCRSCQLNGEYLGYLSTERYTCQWTPVADTIGVSSCSTFRERLHEDDKEVHAVGVDDVEVLIPADVQINTFSDDRRHHVYRLIAERHIDHNFVRRSKRLKDR